MQLAESKAVTSLRGSCNPVTLVESLPQILSDVLLRSANLRQRVIDFGILAGLMQKLEDGTCHDVRMSLLCLDILGMFGKCLQLHDSLGSTREARPIGPGADCTGKLEPLEGRRRKGPEERCQDFRRVGSDG